MTVSADQTQTPSQTAEAPPPTGWRPGVLMGLGAYELVLIGYMLWQVIGSTAESRLDAFLDTGPVETWQAVNIALATVLFAGAAVLALRRKHADRWFALLFALGMLLALHRESDKLWRDQGLSVLYQTIKLGLGAAAGLIALWKIGPLWRAWRQRPWHPAFVLLYCGAGGYVLGQVVATFATVVIRLDKSIKRPSEEGIELLATACFVLAAVDLLVRCVRSRQQR